MSLNDPIAPNIVVSVTPTLTVHASYVTGDYVGTSGVASVIPDAARYEGGSGRIINVALVDAGVASVAGELWIFDAAVTPPADSAAWSISDADAKNLVCVVPFSTYYASALNSVANVNGINAMYRCASDSRSLYCCFVTRGSPTYADGSLTFRIGLRRD